MMLSAQQKAVYDRQIRLWGAESQRRIGSTHVLACNLRGAMVEVCKNLVLAGINSLTVCDDGIITAAELGTNFFADSMSVGQNRADACCPRIQELNTMTKVTSLNGKFGEHLLQRSSYSVVLMAAASTESMIAMNDACRKHNILFYVFRSDASGGAGFVDLGPDFEYRLDTGSGENANLADLQSASYCTLAQLPRIDDTALRQLLDGTPSTAQLPYINAVLGGLFGQDILKAVSRKGCPIYNCLIFDLLSGTATIHLYLPETLKAEVVIMSKPIDENDVILLDD